MTDIPAYRRSIKDNAPQRTSLSDMIVAAMGTMTQQMQTHAQNLPAGEDRGALIANMQEDVRRVRAQFSEPRNVPAHVRMLCGLLRLPRACAFARCRKSQCCRGGGACLDQVDVPEPVLARAVWLMMTGRLRWIASGRGNEPIAYEAWCAAMNARSRLRRAVASSA